MTDAVHVDEQLLGRYVAELGAIGETPDGMYRFLYDEAWQRARDTLLGWITDAGLEGRVDAVGNVFGRLPGSADGDVVLTGSHVDTVPSGGKYDGALGVLGGLAALAALRAHGTPRRTLEVVSLCEEESSRFPANFFGTRAMLGLVGPDEPDRLRDRDGVTLAEAMREAGLDPAAVSTAQRHDLGTFLELHVEQGRVLADEGTDIGLVEVIPGIAWETVTVRGRQDHAGATPMDLRADALQAAAQMAREITAAVEREGRPAVVTTGRWTVEPGQPSVVPGRVEFSVDLRHPDLAVRDRLLDEVHRICADVARRHGVEVDVVRDKDEQPATMDAGLLDVLREATEACGASWRRMPSGAGHDSQLMASRVPTAMLFVPSVEGRSHTPAEYTSPEDCVRGASVLATALHRLAW
ncbi:M20 family metallo-hydrolase [Geodermatophilus sp. DSM 44513]|uniref:M20 family metallo-hydrolase n=1 Tax=Geodermatophilus sp. DSM 44513 TaxID=1528104 RepID=UPI001272C53D|nr:M20 family metallo-hydrolase [Geodermatophilus sp. DSM 44513]WNV74214.1 M20 family metallo-hydrolase [Geodermatophilus sp. DSM 44513]